MSEEEIKSLTTQKLIDNLITLDYRGKEFKQSCLKELLKRNTLEKETQ